jgi:hypothetical protein
MVEKGTLVGLVFLTIGVQFIFAYGVAQMVPRSLLARSVPTAALAFAVAIIGALILLVVPESVSEVAYRAFLNDAIGDIEMLLEELGLSEKAYFFQTEPEEIRAFIPISQASKEGGVNWPPSYALPQLGKESSRLLVDRWGGKGLLLTPPGAQLVKLARVEKGADLETALRMVLVEFSSIASSVLALEEEGSKIMRVQIGKPTVAWESHFLSHSLGSPVSCIASCVAAVVKGQTVRIVDERVDSNLVLLSLETV